MLLGVDYWWLSTWKSWFSLGDQGTKWHSNDNECCWNSLGNLSVLISKQPDIHSWQSTAPSYRSATKFGLVGSGILRICAASSGLKCWCIRASFHCWFSSINSATLHSGSKVGLEMGLNVCGLGIQLLLYTLILSPVPILHLIPWCITFLPQSILLQIKEGLDPNLACKKLVFLKYLSFSTLDKIDCGCWIILQLCFTNNAWLKQAKSLNPSPPLIFA